MKRLAMMLGFLTLGSSLWAAGNSNPLVVSSGSFRGIDLYENNSGGFRQAIVIGDATSSTTVTVDAITGLNVHLSTGATQTVTLIQPNVVGATITFNGTQNVQLQTGANAIGSITNTSFAISTGGVTAAQGAPGTADWPVRLTSTTILSGALTTVTTVTNLSQQGGVAISLNTGVRDTGTQRVTIATNDIVPVSQSGTWDEVGINDSGNSITVDGTVTATQGTAGTADWPVRVSTVALQTGTNNIGTVSGSSITIFTSGGAALPVTGSFSSTSVNITTAAPNAALPTAGQFVGGVGPTGLFQSFAVDASSALQITGSISSTPGPISVANVSGSTVTVGYQTGMGSVPVNVMNTISATAVSVTTGQFNQSFPGVGAAIAFVGPTGLTQAAQVDISSRQVVTVSTGGITASQGVAGTTDWAVRMTSTVVNSGTTYLKVELSTGIRVNTIGGNNLGVDFSTGVQVNGGAASGAAASGNPIQQGVRVTSTTIPTAASDGQMIYTAGSNIGQVLVTGVPWGIISSTYSTTITSATSGPGAESVLISSPGANMFTYLCGCAFTNTTATNGAVVLESPVGTASSRMAIGVPANYLPVGVWPGCTNPFYRSASNSNIMIYQTVAASTQAIYMRCSYYIGP